MSAFVHISEPRGLRFVLDRDGVELHVSEGEPLVGTQIEVIDVVNGDFIDFEVEGFSGGDGLESGHEHGADGLEFGSAVVENTDVR